MKRLLFLRLLVSLAACALLVGSVRAATSFVYVGSYTDWELFGPPRRNPPGARSEGIELFYFDDVTGTLTPVGLAAATDNPTYVTFSPDGRFLYATNEIYRHDGEATGAVSAFAVDAETGRLTFLNQVPAQGTGTCHAVVDHSGRNLLVANFGSGSVAVFPRNPDGSLQPASSTVQHSGSGPHARQAGPHAHAINLTPDNRFAVVSEFGLDRLLVYAFNADAGTLTPHPSADVSMTPASAPRHLAFHPDGRSVYSVNEINSTVTSLRYDAVAERFTVNESVSTLPADFTGRNTAAEIIVHPNGRVLYASNRGHHSIAIFSIGAGGGLQLIGHEPSGGRTPRGYSIDPSGRWLIAANQDSHNVVVFAIDPQTGMLRANGQSQEARIPVSVKFLAAPRS